MYKRSTILHRRSSIPGAIPPSLSAGELAMNINDGVLFVQNAQGTIDTFSNDKHSSFVLNSELSGSVPQYGGNTISQVFSNVLGGYRNDISGAGSTTVNGENNDIQGDFAFIGSGADNKILVSGDFSAILGGRNNLISHQNSFTIGSNLSSHANNFTYVNNLSGVLWGDGQQIRSINAANISSGTLSAARLPAFQGDITTVAGTASATVVKLQGNVVSTQTPSIGQMLQWSGTAWVPGSIPIGGSGGGGVTYYLNYGVSPDAPFANSTYELGRYATTLSLTSVTITNVSQVTWSNIATFVSDYLDPSSNQIPAGLMDLNLWASSTATTKSEMSVRYLLYSYNESLSTNTLVATSIVGGVYEPSSVSQYVISCIIPQTTIPTNSRLYLVLQAQATASNKDVTVYFNGETPTHIHTTIPSVAGSGLVKVVNGVFQTPSSLLVDTDVASNAAISQSKIYNLTTDLNNKLDKTGGTISGDLVIAGTLSTSNTESWQNTYTTVRSKSANWDAVYATTAQGYLNWNSVYSNVNSNSANWGSVYSNVNSNSANAASVYSSVRSTSANWNSVYSNVNSNSANAASVYSSVRSTSANWDVVYADFKRLSSTFLTSETDSQTLSFDNSNKQLSISNGNTISLSGLVDSRVEGLTSSWNSVYSNVNSNSANWDVVYADFKRLSSTFLTSETDSQTLSFNNSNKQLSISNGNTISLSALVDSRVEGLTGSWSSVYSNVNSNSANWGSVYSSVRSASANWNSVYSNVNSNSANWDVVYADFKRLSSTFLTSETDSQTLSFNDSSKQLTISNGNTISLSGLVDSRVEGLTGSWSSVYSNVRSASANWDSVYSNVNSNSANAASVYSSVRSTSANWDIVYADFKRLSSTFLTSETDSQTLSFNDSSKQLSISNGNTISLSALQGSVVDSSAWDSTYSTVRSNSATTWVNSLTSDVTSDLSVGSIVPGDVLLAGTTLQQFVEKLVKATFYPTFVNPSATLTSNLASTVEAGTTGITLTVNFNRGSITGKTVAGIWQSGTFQDYRAGAATNYTILGVNNGTTTAYTSSTAVIGDGSNIFNSTVTYGIGPQPVDSKGANFSTPLAAGSISPTVTVTGRRRAFYGVDNAGATSANIRSLQLSTLNPVAGTGTGTLTIPISAGSASVVFAYPNTLQDVTSVKESVLNAEVKTAFTKTTVAVEGLNGYAATNYKVYRYVPVEPFASTVTYTVTI